MLHFFNAVSKLIQDLYPYIMNIHLHEKEIDDCQAKRW